MLEIVKNKIFRHLALEVNVGRLSKTAERTSLGFTSLVAANKHLHDSLGRMVHIKGSLKGSDHESSEHETQWASLGIVWPRCSV